MWDMLKPLIEKATLGTITRGLIWGIAFLTGYFQVESPGSDTVDKVAAWATAIVMAIIALVWSKFKDDKNKKSLPPVAPHDGAKL